MIFQVERLTDFYENNSKQVIDAVAEHNNKQAEKILGEIICDDRI